jgi:uncharacterized protein YciI
MQSSRGRNNTVLTEERRTELRAQVKALRGGAYKHQFFAALWTDNPARSDDDFLEVLPEHFQHMAALEADGIMFGSGPFTPPDGAAETFESMTIVRADSHEAAAEILDAMPMARHGLRTYDLFAWNMSVGSVSVTIALRSGMLRLE